MRTPEPSVAGSVANRARQPADPARTPREVIEAALEVARHESHRRPQGERHRAQDRREQGERGRSAAGEGAAPQAEPAHDHRQQVERVLNRVVGRHPAGDHPRLHAGAAQRPHRHRDAPRSRGRQQPDRRDPGERDLDARAPAEPGHAAREHGAEQDRVAGNRHQLEAGRHRQPQRIATLEPAPRLVEPGELRNQEVQPDQSGGDEQRPEHEIAPRDRAGRAPRRQVRDLDVPIPEARFDVRVRRRLPSRCGLVTVPRRVKFAAHTTLSTIEGTPRLDAGTRNWPCPRAPTLSADARARAPRDPPRADPRAPP